ncbi:uncharacterized protein LOC116344524 [Contarinia nasturtii]|uniref:uncharacterized protein LOC116344524 n=1 Tax=Contarinia nasturtii TaxID=265458 RepID=UPI0012D40DFD|nr:uncharacterized protein LOC116344524 [Contarinia nasturtii]
MESSNVFFDPILANFSYGIFLESIVNDISSSNKMHHIRISSSQKKQIDSSAVPMQEKEATNQSSMGINLKNKVYADIKKNIKELSVEYQNSNDRVKSISNRIGSLVESLRKS